MIGLVIVPDILEDLLHTYGRDRRWAHLEFKDLGSIGDDAGDGHAALLSAGELEGREFQHFVPQAHEMGGLADPAVDLLLRKSHVPGAEGDVPVDGLFKKLILRILKDQSYLKAGLAGPLFILPDILAVKEDLTAGGFEQAVEMLDEGGFA